MPWLFPPIDNASRRIPWVSWACALSPFFLLFAVATLAIHVRLGLGHWPTPMFENYETPAFHLNGLFFVGTMFFAWLGAGPLWLLCLCLRPLRPAWPREIQLQFLTCIAGWLLIGATIALDPASFSTWLLD